MITSTVLPNSEKRAVQAIMGMLGSAVKAWHCAAGEFLGRMIINPDNEPLLLPFVPQVYHSADNIFLCKKICYHVINCNKNILNCRCTSV